MMPVFQMNAELGSVETQDLGEPANKDSEKSPEFTSQAV